MKHKELKSAKFKKYISIEPRTDADGIKGGVVYFNVGVQSFQIMPYVGGEDEVGFFVRAFDKALKSFIEDFEGK